MFISEFIISLLRLDESKGYMLSDSEEVNLFIMQTAMMSFVQCIILFCIFKFLRRNQLKKSMIACNLFVHFLLLIWFIYSVYQFTINGL